jgi:hypothetical protein
VLVLWQFLIYHLDKAFFRPAMADFTQAPEKDLEIRWFVCYNPDHYEARPFLFFR